MRKRERGAQSGQNNALLSLRLSRVRQRPNRPLENDSAVPGRPHRPGAPAGAYPRSAPRFDQAIQVSAPICCQLVNNDWWALGSAAPSSEMADAKLPVTTGPGGVVPEGKNVRLVTKRGAIMLVVISLTIIALAVAKFPGARSRLRDRGLWREDQCRHAWRRMPERAPCISMCRCTLEQSRGRSPRRQAARGSVKGGRGARSPPSSRWSSCRLEREGSCSICEFSSGRRPPPCTI